MGKKGTSHDLGALSGQIEEAAGSLGISLKGEQLEAFVAHAELIARWSGRVRLVGDPSPEALAVRHFVDSLTVSLVVDPQADLRADARALDVGSGAGFPGLVLSVLWPEMRWQLLEVDRRKAAFLNAAVAGLGLAPRVRVVNSAAEGDPEGEGVELADLVLARAVRGPERLLPWLSPYLRPEGRVVGMLGPAFASEEALLSVEADTKLERVAVWRGELPEGAGHRTVVAWS